jgi:hypothetical protein
MLVHQNHAAGGENGSIVVGMFVSLCLASKKPSEREFFVPAGTYLGVKLFNLVPCLPKLLKYSLKVIVRARPNKSSFFHGPPSNLCSF